MDAEWLGAAAVVALAGLFLWRSGASPALTLLVLALVIAGIAATALLWELLITSEG